MTNILYWMTQSYSTQVINRVTGDAKYSVLEAAAIHHVISNFTGDAKYSVSKGATIPCHYPCHKYSVLDGAIIYHFTKTQRCADYAYTYLMYKSWVFEAYLITNTSIHFRWKIFNRWKGARRDKSTFFESSKQINFIDDVWDDWWNWIEDLIQSFLLTLKMIFPTHAENDFSFPCWK